MTGLVSLAITEIVPSKTNRRIDEDQLKELAESIKAHGVLSPVLVRPVDDLPGERNHLKHELVFGHRRVLAAKSAGLEEIPAIIREMSDVEALEADTLLFGHGEPWRQGAAAAVAAAREVARA